MHRYLEAVSAITDDLLSKVRALPSRLPPLFPYVYSRPHAARLQVDVPVYVLHSLGDTLCQASASKHFQSIHTNRLPLARMSKFVYPEQGKHELLQEAGMWKVGTRCSNKPLLCVVFALYLTLTSSGSPVRRRPLDGRSAAARVTPRNKPPDYKCSRFSVSRCV